MLRPPPAVQAGALQTELMGKIFNVGLYAS